MRTYTEHKTRTSETIEETIPESWIPVDEAGIEESKDMSIMEMRWHANKLIEKLWRNYTGRTIKEYQGKEYFVPSKSNKITYLSDEAVKELVTIIDTVVNPTTSLGHTKEEEAKHFKQGLHEALNELMVTSKHFDGVDVPRLKIIEEEIVGIVWHQLSRAIGGREAKNAVTRIAEQYGKSDSNITESVNTGSKGWGFGSSNKTNPYAEGGRS